MGRLRCRRASVTTSPGMVAENSMVCRSAGVRLRILSTSGRKPRSSILSASSRTRACTWPRFRWPWRTRSSRRPGVPTTMSTDGQRLDLRLVGPAAVEHDHLGADPAAGDLQVIGDLDGQFPGRHDDQRARRGLDAAAGHLVQALQDRHAEGEGLAGAGPGLADEVMALQRDRQRQRLDREGGGDALRLQRGADGLGDAEVSRRSCRWRRRAGTSPISARPPGRESRSRRPRSPPARSPRDRWPPVRRLGLMCMLSGLPPPSKSPAAAQASTAPSQVGRRSPEHGRSRRPEVHGSRRDARRTVSRAIYRAMAYVAP